MQKIIEKGLLVLVFAMLIFADASAQRQGRRRTTPPQTGGNDNTVNPPVNTGGRGRGGGNNNNNNAVSGDPYGNLPVRYDTSSSATGNGGKSLRNDNAFDKGFTNERIPLEYEHLRWDDALFAEKIWRELDLREKINQTFRYNFEGENGSEVFVNILMNAINKGGVKAFQDDRFTTPIDSASVTLLTAGRADTSYEYDINDINKVVGKVISSEQFDINSITKLRLKEEWVFDKEASRMFVRIIGIAPIKVTVGPDGNERSQVLFWAYYPDLRETFAKYEVYNPKNMGNSRMTWEELFESRMFSSYIVKSTIENPLNRTIKQYIKDPILALLEGENIKEKIFNYEQNLWAY